MEDLTKVGFLLWLSPAGNKDVIQIGEDEEDAPKNIVYQPLQCLGGILKPKGHAEELPEHEGSDDGRVWDVCQCNRDLVVATDRSILENIFLPARLLLKLCMCGGGYLSSMVALLRCRKLSQGLQPAPGFGTM